METETEASSSKEQTPKDTSSNQPICLIVLGKSENVFFTIAHSRNEFLLITVIVVS